jgi:excisionase family DNA binding protein
MQKRVLTTTEASELLGASRQHVADLGDRGEIPCWRAGSHRRFRREDVMAYKVRIEGPTAGNLETMNLSDRRSLAYGLLLAERLVVSPDVVLTHARRNLDRLRTVHSDGSADLYLDKWTELLDGPVEAVLHVLTSVDEKSVNLRHAAPFAGVLSNAERRSVIRATRRAAA